MSFYCSELIKKYKVGPYLLFHRNHTYILIDRIENSYLGNGIQMIILQLMIFKIDPNLLTLFSNILTDDFCETKKRDDF